MARVTGMWVYQSLGEPPDPDAVAGRAARHGMRWITAEAIVGGEVARQDWLRGMRRATRERGIRLGVHGFVGRPTPAPAAEAKTMSRAIESPTRTSRSSTPRSSTRRSPAPVSKRFARRYRALKADFRTYFSSFGRPEFHPGSTGPRGRTRGFCGMPQAYENLNAELLKPRLCVDDWARFFAPRHDDRPTLGCFAEHGQAAPPAPAARRERAGGAAALRSTSTATARSQTPSSTHSMPRRPMATEGFARPLTGQMTRMRPAGACLRNSRKTKSSPPRCASAYRRGPAATPPADRWSRASGER